MTDYPAICNIDFQPQQFCSHFFCGSSLLGQANYAMLNCVHCVCVIYGGTINHTDCCFFLCVCVAICTAAEEKTVRTHSLSCAHSSLLSTSGGHFLVHCVTRFFASVGQLNGRPVCIFCFQGFFSLCKVKCVNGSRIFLSLSPLAEE